MPKHEIMRPLHSRQRLRVGLEPPLRAKQLCVRAIRRDVLAVDVPRAHSDLRAGRQVDAVVDVALGADFPGQQARRGRVVAQGFLDAGVEEGQVERAAVRDDLREGHVRGIAFGLQARVHARVRDDVDEAAAQDRR